MLIAIDKVHRRGADSEPEIIRIAINPETIDEVVPYCDSKVDDPCVVLSVHGDRVIHCKGSVDRIVAQAYEALWGPPRQDNEVHL